MDIMKCPDCQGLLGKVSLTGFDDSFRCQACGGFWMQSWVVNKVVMEDMSQWSRLGTAAQESLRTNLCPTDGAAMVGVDQSQTPERVKASKCEKCGWWWFPGDNLFDFKVAQVARVNYIKWWGRAGDVAKLALPAIMVVLLTVGLGMGLTTIRRQTGWSAPAAVTATEVKAERRDQVMVISFKADKFVSQIEYVPKGSTSWQKAAVVPAGDRFQAVVSGLEWGGAYLVRIAGAEYEFIAE